MTRPYRYQRKGVRKISRFQGRALLADEMGLGKTFQALLWAKQNETARPIVVVCPAALKYNWEREAATHTSMRAEVLEGKKVPKRRLLRPHQFVIINYDILGPWLPYLKRMKPQLIILDECHYCKSRTAQRTKHVQKLCRDVPHIIALSGTPLTNRPAELWPILNLLRPKSFPSFVGFAFEYCKPERKPWGWEFKGARNLEQLHKILKRKLMIRRLKADVLPDLLPKTRHIIPLDIRNRKEYNHALQDFLGWLRKRNKSKAKRAAKAERLVKFGYLKRLAAKLKQNAVYEWIDNFLESSDGKLIVFGIHKSILRKLYERYKAISVLVDGSVTGKKRQIAVDKFQKRKKCRLLIGNVKAGGVGLTMTAAQTVAFVELPWTPGEVTQAEDRSHRIGQKEPVFCYYLIAKNTIEESLCRLIQEKQQVLNDVLDGGTSDDSLEIFNQLEQILRKEGAKCHA